MISVLGQTPPWLPEHTFGKGLFTVEPTANRQSPPKSGPWRTIARRGDEIFVAVGNQLRWADWKILDHQWQRERELRKQQQARQKKKTEEDVEEDESQVVKGDGGSEPNVGGAKYASYRVLKVPVWEEIRQLIISPLGDLIAILTSHTVHVAVLPDPSHLRGPGSEPVRVRAYTVGSTTHVLARPAVASALWHPLGIAGHCLVTTTTDAIVRIWEFDLENRWSFDSPRLTINLKRLADGLPQDQDLAASRMSANKVFSPDSVEMEVATACFGGPASPIHHPWAAMTLWIAMREGDVYALCPLLPSRWTCTPALASSLSTCIASDVALARADASLSASQHRILDERLNWFTQVERQRYAPDSPHSKHASDLVFYRRPDEPGPIPDLQGPFQLDLLPDEDDENTSSLLTDIHIIPPTFHLPARGRSGIKSVSEDVEGLSWGIVCLLRDSGRLHVLLDVEGIQGQWASQDEIADDDADALELDDVPSLLHLWSIDFAGPGSDLTWPLFTPAPHSANSVFVTCGHGVIHLSLSYLVDALEKEIRAGGGSGADLRLDVIATAQAMTVAQTIFEHEHSRDSTTLTRHLPACVVFPTSRSECMLMTARPGASIAVAYAAMRGGRSTAAVAGDAGTEDHESNNKSLVRRGQRPAYVPAPGLSVHLPLSAFIEQQIRGRNKGYFSKDTRFSQPTLSIMTDAHTILSRYTHILGNAAAELFRQCERMLEEFRDQIKNVKEVGYRVDHVIDEDRPNPDGCGDDDNPRPKLSRDDGIRHRIELAKSKNRELTRRITALRRKGNTLGEPIRSAKEEAWTTELERLQSTVLDDHVQGDGNNLDRASIRTRYLELKRLASELLPEVEAMPKRRPNPAAASTEARVPAAIREKKAQQIRQMLERESALLEATKSRLQQLSLVFP